MFNTKIALLALSMVVARPMVAHAKTTANNDAPFACPAGDSKDSDGQCVPYQGGSGSLHHHEHHNRRG